MNVATKWIASLAIAASVAVGGAFAQNLEKTDVELGVGGASLLYYLPLTIAVQKGYFAEEGLNVKVNDFKGGSKSLQALVGGSVDVVAGAYEHTIRMQVKKQPIVAVVEMGRLPGIVVAVKSDLKDKVKTAADLKGLKIGVTAPGSGTHNFLNFVLGKSGVKPDEVTILGVGGGLTAVSAITQGEADAITNLDPAIAQLVAGGDVFVLADSRTEEGTREIFGTDNLPAAVLYLKEGFVKENPNTTQALVNAIYKSLQWLKTATPEDVAATVPEEYFLGNKELYLAAVKSSLPTYSVNGMVTPEGEKAALGLMSFDDDIANADIDLSKTFDGSFVEKSAAAIN